MATRTTNLSLELPNNGEYRDSWDTPNNANFTKVDIAYGLLAKEIQEARFTKSSLKGFLEVAHNSDGTLLPTEEVEKARNSFLYGHKDGTTPFTLDTLLLKKDKDIWAALEGEPSIRKALANRFSVLPDQIISGSKTGLGYPAWSGYTGAKALAEGTTTPIYMVINGFLNRIRSLKEVTISGGAGWYFVYAEHQDDGQVIQSGTEIAVCGEDNNQEVRLHEHDGTNYVVAGVKVGDILRYTTPATVAGDYIVEEVAPNGNVDQLLIRGVFPESIGSITYQIIDPLAVTLGFTDDPSTLTENQFIVMEAYYDGVSAVTSVKPRNFGDKFVSEWRAIDVSSVPNFEEEFTHYLGTDALDITIQACQVNDGTEAVEELSLAKINNTLGVNADKGTLAVGINNNLTHSVTNTLMTQSAGTDPHTHVVAGTGSLTVDHGGTISASISGNITASLTGGVTPYNSVLMKATRNSVWIKNAVASLFYRDYDNADRQTGYLRVIVTKKG